MLASELVAEISGTDQLSGADSYHGNTYSLYVKWFCIIFLYSHIIIFVSWEKTYKKFEVRKYFVLYFPSSSSPIGWGPDCENQGSERRKPGVIAGCAAQ